MSQLCYVTVNNKNSYWMSQLCYVTASNKNSYWLSQLCYVTANNKNSYWMSQLCYEHQTTLPGRFDAICFESWVYPQRPFKKKWITIPYT